MKFKETPIAEHSEILSANRAAACLDVSISYLYKLTNRGSIAYYKPAGKKIYFKKTDLENYLLQNRVKPASEISEAAIIAVGKSKNQ